MARHRQCDGLFYEHITDIIRFSHTHSRGKTAVPFASIHLLSPRVQDDVFQQAADLMLPMGHEEAPIVQGQHRVILHETV